jgi:hypothetical protein
MSAPVAELPPPLALFRMATGYYISRAIWVVAELGIADHLAAGPRDVGDLAAATETHAPSLRRVLRLLASAGVFVEQADGRMALTPIGECLRAGVPGSMRAGALLFAGRTQDSWSDLLYSVRTGEPIYPHRFGLDVWTYTAQHPEYAALFDEAMADFTRQAAIAVAAAYDFSPFKTIVDVGGGAGVLLAGILNATPAARPNSSSTSFTTGTTSGPPRSCASAVGPWEPAPGCSSWRACTRRVSTSPTPAGGPRRTT